MPAVTTPAIVLHGFPYSETSRILRLLTRDHGVQSVIAKGAQQPKSRFAGMLEVFNEGMASFTLRESRDLHTLIGFDLLISRAGLAGDLVRFGGGSLIAEIVMRVASEQADPDLYDRVNQALENIQHAESALVEPTVLAEAWAAIAALGFAPSLDSCIHCGRTLGPEENATFDYTAGGARCLDCSAGMGGRTIPPEARKALLDLVLGVPVRVEKPAAYWRLLDRYLAHHVMEGQTLRAMAFLAGTLGGPRLGERG